MSYDIIPFVLLPVFCCVWIYLNALMLYRGFASKKWPTTTGVICTSEIRLPPYTDPIAENVEVRFEYSVEGKKYIGNQWSFDVGGYLTKSIPMKILGRYPKGSSVKVFFHPKKPALAVLEPGPKSFIAYGFFVILGFSLLALSVALLFKATTVPS